MAFMPGHEASAKKPAHWAKVNGAMHCLACRRDNAAEGALDGLPEDTPLDKKVQAQSEARIDFEVKRDPEKANGEIAKACRSSIASVQKARERLGLQQAS